MEDSRRPKPVVTVTFNIHGHGPLAFSAVEMADVSRQWCAFRDAHDFGASDVTGGECYVAGLWLGKMSYNGKIWPEATWSPEHQPIFVP